MSFIFVDILLEQKILIRKFYLLIHKNGLTWQQGLATLTFQLRTQNLPIQTKDRLAVHSCLHSNPDCTMLTNPRRDFVIFFPFIKINIVYITSLGLWLGRHLLT